MHFFLIVFPVFQQFQLSLAAKDSKESKYTEGGISIHWVHLPFSKGDPLCNCNILHGSRDQRVAVFNFGTDRVRVLEKTLGSGSGTDRVRVLALHFYQSGIIGY